MRSMTGYGRAEYSDGGVISYDNPNSIKHKCNYVLDNELGGLMFWDYGEDLTGSLVNAIYNTLKNPNAGE